MPRSRLSTASILQLIALAPILVCTVSLYLEPELTPRLSLGLLTYAAVALSYLAGGLALAGPWRLLPLLVPLASWVAQLRETEVGLALLAAIALLFGLFPLRRNRYRLFGFGAAILLAISAYKLRSYGFY